MSGDSFVTPLSVKHMYVINSAFGIHGSPAEHMQAELSVDVDEDETPVFDADRRCYALSKTVDVAYNLIDVENAEATPLHASVTVLIEAFLPVEDKDERAEEFMLSSCVSIAYSHARSCIMSMAAMSPVRELVIPTIYPRALVKAAEDEADE